MVLLLILKYLYQIQDINILNLIFAPLYIIKKVFNINVNPT